MTPSRHGKTGFPARLDKSNPTYSKVAEPANLLVSVSSHSTTVKTA